MPKKYDILIAGAGFAGSLTALVLNNIGFSVCLLEKGRHPRFAIGESSTPIADMILRNLSQKYNLPWLHSFSRYGSWQQRHPQVVCGIKRGFSYFKHHPGQPFATDAMHNNELLVAASVSDTLSDTNWLRASFDAFLVNKVKEAGIDYYDLTEIVSATQNEGWTMDALRLGEAIQFQASFLIDATGGGNLLEQTVGVKSRADDFLTNSFGVFSHFNQMPTWMGMLGEAGIATDDFPYNPDNSALHHVLDEGWIWVLRFNNGLTSFGFALDGGNQQFADMQAQEIWAHMLAKYPSVDGIIKNATLAGEPGKIVKSARLQRRAERCFGPGWAVLPHTAGFVDPLFSSGIAHSLTGIEKLTGMLQQYWGDDALYHHLQQYETAVFAELRLVDMLVAGCYKTMAHFALFNTWSMLYFAATITCEQRRLKNEAPGYFLGADNAYIVQIVQESYADLLQILAQGQPLHADAQHFTATVRQRIKPVNIAGLMEPSFKNMYRHTMAVL